MKIFKELIALFYPNTCVGCNEVIDEEEFLCDYCISMIERTDLNKFCLRCGNLKKECKCSKQVLYYDGCVSPFYNEGIAQKIMYAYKFRRKEMYAEFLVKQMALSLKQGFYEQDFDCVCCVPIESRKQLKRGYNQSAVLASGIANLLEIPFYDGVLGCYKKKKEQHKIAIKERFKNVKDIYYVKKPLKNKNILLVDDIKTTGATLSECSKVLLASGANKVYCVTALVTKMKGKKNGN